MRVGFRERPNEKRQAGDGQRGEKMYKSRSPTMFYSRDDVDKISTAGTRTVRYRGHGYYRPRSRRLIAGKTLAYIIVPSRPKQSEIKTLQDAKIFFRVAKRNLCYPKKISGIAKMPLDSP